MTHDVMTTRLFADDWVFQNVGATCHTSRSTTAFLTKKKLNVLGTKENPWSPKSPDQTQSGIGGRFSTICVRQTGMLGAGSILKLKIAVAKA